jgi:hypothetical protein
LEAAQRHDVIGRSCIARSPPTSTGPSDEIGYLEEA